MRGYFGIGIYDGKFGVNLGTLWRSSYQLGASFIFTIGSRYKCQASDTTKSWKHVPLYQYIDWEDFYKHVPRECKLIGIEMGGRTIKTFVHPERAIYLLGSEDIGLPEAIFPECDAVMSLPSVNQNSYNVAIAGSLVMFDRANKNGSL